MHPIDDGLFAAHHLGGLILRLGIVVTVSYSKRARNWLQIASPPENEYKNRVPVGTLKHSYYADP